MSFVIQIKLCLLTKDCRLRKTLGLVEFCGVLRKWWKSGTSRLFEGMASNDRPANKSNWKDIQLLVPKERLSVEGWRWSRYSQLYEKCWCTNLSTLNRNRESVKRF